jgi:hypothetical protein
MAEAAERILMTGPVHHLNCPQAEHHGSMTVAPEMGLLQQATEDDGAVTLIYECRRCGIHVSIELDATLHTLLGKMGEEVRQLRWEFDAWMKQRQEPR